MISKNSVNKVILVGRVGNKPELKFTPSGNSICTFSMATNETWLDLENNKKEHTEWHNIVGWNKIADFTHEHIVKGQLIYIEGRIHAQVWVDKNNIRQKKYEIVCEKITPLGIKKVP